jgi:hypothetical protein
MTRVIAILAILNFTTPMAGAFEIAQECKSMKDPIGCTCAVQNGGVVKMRPGGGVRWASKPNGYGATKEAFVQCNIRAHGHR